jgi:hypothetical protein
MTAGDPVCRGSVGQFPNHGVRRSCRTYFGRVMYNIDRTSIEEENLLRIESIQLACSDDLQSLGDGSDPSYHNVSNAGGSVLNNHILINTPGAQHCPLGSTTVVSSF